MPAHHSAQTVRTQSVPPAQNERRERRPVADSQFIPSSFDDSEPTIPGAAPAGGEEKNVDDTTRTDSKPATFVPAQRGREVPWFAWLAISGLAIVALLLWNPKQEIKPAEAPKAEVVAVNSVQAPSPQPAPMQAPVVINTPALAPVAVAAQAAESVKPTVETESASKAQAKPARPTLEWGPVALRTWRDEHGFGANRRPELTALHDVLAYLEPRLMFKVNDDKIVPVISSVTEIGIGRETIGNVKRLQYFCGVRIDGIYYKETDACVAKLLENEDVPQVDRPIAEQQPPVRFGHTVRRNHPDTTLASAIRTREPVRPAPTQTPAPATMPSKAAPEVKTAPATTPAPARSDKSAEAVTSEGRKEESPSTWDVPRLPDGTVAIPEREKQHLDAERAARKADEEASKDFAYYAAEMLYLRAQQAYYNAIIKAERDTTKATVSAADLLNILSYHPREHYFAAAEEAGSEAAKKHDLAALRAEFAAAELTLCKFKVERTGWRDCKRNLHTRLSKPLHLRVRVASAR